MAIIKKFNQYIKEDISNSETCPQCGCYQCECDNEQVMPLHKNPGWPLPLEWEESRIDSLSREEIIQEIMDGTDYVLSELEGMDDEELRRLWDEHCNNDIDSCVSGTKGNRPIDWCDETDEPLFQNGNVIGGDGNFNDMNNEAMAQPEPENEYVGTRLMRELAEELGTEVKGNKIEYNGQTINFYSETEKFHIGKEKFDTVEDVVEYLNGSEPNDDIHPGPPNYSDTDQEPQETGNYLEKKFNRFK